MFGCSRFSLKLSKPGISNNFINIWLTVSTHLKNISQHGNLPQIGVNIKNIWNHHLDIHRGITNVSKKNLSGTENLRVAIPKKRSFDEVSNDKGFTFIYHWSIIIYICLWLWLTLNLLKRNTSTWPSSCRRRPLSRTPKTSRIHNLEGAVGCLRGKKTGHNKSRFLSKQENITENLLQGQISVHHDNFPAQCQHGSTKVAAKKSSLLWLMTHSTFRFHGSMTWRAHSISPDSSTSQISNCSC